MSGDDRRPGTAGSDGDLYAVLGLGRTASQAEVRRAYITLARRYHPDAQGDDAVVRSASERRMQRINEAWSVLGDTDRRRSYDRHERTRVVFERVSREWEPIEPDDGLDVDPRDLIDDRPIGAGETLPRILQLAPALLVLASIVLFAIGLVVALPVLYGLAVVCLVVGGVSFLAAPFIAVMRSRRNELG